MIDASTTYTPGHPHEAYASLAYVEEMDGGGILSSSLYSDNTFLLRSSIQQENPFSTATQSIRSPLLNKPPSTVAYGKAKIPAPIHIFDKLTLASNMVLLDDDDILVQNAKEARSCRGGLNRLGE